MTKMKTRCQITQDFQNLQVRMQNLWSSRQIYREIMRIFTEIEDRSGSGIVKNWISRNYVFSTLIQIRSMLDTRTDTISLRSFVNDVRRAKNLFSLEWLEDSFKDREWGRDCYSKIASEKGQRLDMQRMENQLEEIENSHNNLKSFTNKTLAHVNTNFSTVAAKLQEIDEVIDKISNFLNEYQILVVGSEVGNTAVGDTEIQANLERVFGL